MTTAIITAATMIIFLTILKIVEIKAEHKSSWIRERFHDSRIKEIYHTKKQKK